MNRPLLLVAAVLVLLGVVWMGQGSGLIGGSAMTGSTFWLVIGLLLVAAGVVLFAREWIRRSNP